MSAVDTEPFPRGALYAAGVLIIISIVGAGVSRLQKISTVQPAHELFTNPVVSSVDLGFTDQADGSVAVRDSHTGRQIGTLSPGVDGFIRGVVRGLAHDRMRRHIGTAPPFRLSELKSGRLYLEDTATGRIIDLQAFGGDNRGAFKRFLPADGGRA